MVDKGSRKGRSREAGRRRKRYEDYINDKAYGAMAAAAIGKRLPYHLTYARRAGEAHRKDQRRQRDERAIQKQGIYGQTGLCRF